MSINLGSVIIPTAVARSGSTVRDVVRECIATGVRAIPYVDAQDQVIGLCSLKNIVKRTLVPEYMVEAIKLLGDNFQVLEDAHAAVAEVFDEPIEPFLYESYWPVTPDTPLIKAIAVMQTYRTDYAFVIDEEHHYQGIVTILSIAQRLMEDHPQT